MVHREFCISIGEFDIGSFFAIRYKITRGIDRIFTIIPIYVFFIRFWICCFGFIDDDDGASCFIYETDSIARISSCFEVTRIADSESLG
jgi:hypothetical protein